MTACKVLFLISGAKCQTEYVKDNNVYLQLLQLTLAVDKNVCYLNRSDSYQSETFSI